MRALDDVVLRLSPLRVAGDAVLHAQAGEVLTPGQKLVHVRLVTGVPDDRVTRGIEHPVDAERQFHDTEVRPQVTTRLGDLRHEETTDLARELDELDGGQTVKIAGGRERSRVVPLAYSTRARWSYG